MTGPQLVQGRAPQRTIAHDALRLRSIDDFPRFADALVWRQFFSEKIGKPPPSPNAFYENRLEGEGSCCLGLRDSRPGLQNGKFVGRFGKNAMILIEFGQKMLAANGTISQRLVSGSCLDGGDFSRFHRSAVVGTDLAHPRSHFALARSQISWDTINRLHLVIRKLGHITEYGILAALFWRALRSLASLQKPILLTLVLCGCAVFAAGDELHQSCVPGRTASGGDVLIDILGAFIGTSICALVACGQPRAA